ncbi:MAG: hypothetical protein C7B43_10990 [Sulfobacillus benefaciens]|uniref:Helicase ATP-binding domain-containing protein n=1 Tax=Sulfobacillus benefaciens TaxID=453960 RepID=A0A2T2X0A3_9FIRM|nr:MAG: hypothetical protein C7B43_10990 [Sulfobacillus benefaciens]
MIYVVPTKALANDLMVRLSGPLSHLGIRLGNRHGDRDDVRHRSHPPQILLTTPESLDVLLFNHEQSIRSVNAIVVDEVHILNNTQRGLHLSILLRRLQEQSLNPIQVVALSATLANLEPAVRDVSRTPAERVSALHRRQSVRAIKNHRAFKRSCSAASKNCIACSLVGGTISGDVTRASFTRSTGLNGIRPHFTASSRELCATTSV